MEFKNFKLKELFDKRTMKGYPKKEENLKVNNDWYYVYGQNIKRQYPFKVLMDEKYLHKIEPDAPILAYTSSVWEIWMIEESFYRSWDNWAFQWLFPKSKLNKYELLYILTVLRKQFINFWYATNMDKIIDLEFSLPSSDWINPDYKYMKERIIELEKERIIELETYLNVTWLSDYELSEKDLKILSLSLKKWIKKNDIVKILIEMAWKWKNLL